MKENFSIKKISTKTIIAILAIAWLLITIVPFIFMLLAGFKQQFEMLMGSVFDLPKSLYLKNFIDVFKGNIFIYFKNSMVILLFLSACASYPLSRFKFKLNKPIYGIIVACMSVPVHVTLLPIFLMTTNMGLYDTPWALIGPYVAFNLPISVFILVTFMHAIPRELEEAAEI